MTRLPLNGVERDTHLAADTANDKYVVPKDGYYRVKGQAMFTNLPGSARQLRMEIKTGAGAALSKSYVHVNTSEDAAVRSSTTYWLDEGIDIEFFVYNMTGSSIDLVQTAAETFVDIECLDYYFLSIELRRKVYHSCLESSSMIQRLYQKTTALNYDYGILPIPHSTGQGEFQTYDLINVSKRDEMLKAIIEEVSEGDTFYDIGSNIGNYSFSVALGGAKSHAFEPDPTMYDYLAKNCKQNSSLSVIPHRVALADTNGEATFYRSEDRGSGSLTQENAARKGVLDAVSVPVRTITVMVEQTGVPDIVKIDAEGQLIDVLHGAKAILEEHSPILFFEPHNDHPGIDYSDSDYTGLLEKHGYTVSEQGRFVEAR